MRVLAYILLLFLLQINISAQNTIHLCEGDTAENFAVPANNGSTYNWTIQGSSNIANIVRQIDELVSASQEASNHTQIWDASYFEKGVYMIELHINSVKVTSERVVIQ